MLRHLRIKNLVIVDFLELDFFPGMSVLTGETGAGKSILLDALGLILGHRASPELIRQNAEQAEISAIFCIENNLNVLEWLKIHDLADERQCVIRRILQPEGRSKAYINGHLVSLQQLKALGDQLVDLHGQHEHQSLLHNRHQLKLLDAFAGLENQRDRVKECHDAWQDTRRDLTEKRSTTPHPDQLTLLRYQIEELEALQLQDDEISTLMASHKKLAEAQDLQTHADWAMAQLESGDDEGNLPHAVRAFYQRLQTMQKITPEFNNCLELLEQCLIQLDETGRELRIICDTIEIDPKKLEAVEQRLSLLHDMARKHRVKPEALKDHLQQLQHQQQSSELHNEQMEHLNTLLVQQEKDYQAVAEQLSQQRKAAAKKLCQAVEEKMQLLAMPHAQFEIRFQEKATAPSPEGFDHIEFYVSTNLGQDLQPLKRVASGGELSRISLSIQVITARRMTIPCLVFDEVDVGISGPTAQVVGKLLRELGQHCQILCVTHLPQVAALGHQHYHVQKSHQEGRTFSRIQKLDEQSKIHELAKMLSGESVTPEARAHAETLIAL